MTAVATPLRRLWAELALLTTQTARTWARLAAPIVGLMLIGWSGNELSILLGTEVSSSYPWLVIPVLAMGVVVQLVTIVVALRLVAIELGMPAMLARAPGADPAETGRETTLARLVAVTLLPFLVMYAAFGFLADYARRLVTLSTYRHGADLVSALNPGVEWETIWTSGTFWVLVAILVVGYPVQVLIERRRDHFRHPLLVGLVLVVLEATLGFVVLLGAFRIVDVFVLWAQGREAAAWLEHGVAWLRGLFPFDLPAIVVAGWSFFVEQVWPVVLHGLTRPFLWLAMAGLVFGSRMLTLADLWRVGEPTTEATTRRQGMLARLRSDSAQARGLRSVVLNVEELVLDGIDVQVLPAWQSLRLVLRAGWPFLGAYAIAFTVLDAAGSALEGLVDLVLGGHRIEFWLKAWPFVDLISMVGVMSVTWVLLGVAYTRALSIFTETGPDGVQPVLVPGRGGSGGRRSTAVEALTVAVVTVAVVVAVGLVPSGAEADVRRGVVGQAVPMQGQEVGTGSPRLATTIRTGSDETRTDGVFVVVGVWVASPGPDGGLVDVTLVSGERTYHPYDSGFGPSALPGFRAGKDLVFEVDPADVGPAARLAFRPVEVVSGYQQWVEIPLGLAAEDVAAALPETVVDPYGAVVAA